MSKIKTIGIHALRGIPNLELELDGKNLLLRGDNGTGKSSFIDAIEFFFTGEISHLKGTQGLSMQRHATNIKFKPKDVNVAITFKPGNINLRRTFKDAPLPPNPLQKYFEIAQKGTFILHRSQILEFINSKPADRFVAIGNIIGLGFLDEFELVLMKVRDELCGIVNSKKERHDDLMGKLSEIVEKKVVNNKELLSALNDKLKKADLSLVSSFDELDEYSEKLLKISKVENLEKIEGLKQILQMTSATFISEENISHLMRFNSQIKIFLEEYKTTEFELTELLEMGRKVLVKERANICPLCEQKVSPEELLERIDARLKVVTGLSDRASELRQLIAQLKDGLSASLYELNSLLQKIKASPELEEESRTLANIVKFYNLFKEA
jgi:predicted ATP-dependent endonuclease of OLD family